MNPNPVLVEATRGEMIESRHRGAIVVVHSDGQTALAVGDVKGLIYPRSAIKPLQALILLESGAADAFALTDTHLALACASHNGEPGHVAVVRDWLARLDLDAQVLECGAHAPRRGQDHAALVREGVVPGAAHNNCSGKHCGFLTVARHLGETTEGYIGKTHPVQQAVLDLVGEMAGVSLRDAPGGIDGCGIPVSGMALEPLALAFARFATGVGMDSQRQAAAERIFQAMVQEPFMVAGSGRWCTRAIEAAQGACIVKTGAEGVYCGAVPKAGVGIALKIDDGAARAAECAMGAVLSRIPSLLGRFSAHDAELVRTPVLNVAGRPVGELRPSETLAQQLAPLSRL